MYDKFPFLTPKSPRSGFSKFSLLLAPSRDWGKTGKEIILNYVEYVVCPGDLVFLQFQKWGTFAIPPPNPRQRGKAGHESHIYNSLELKHKPHNKWCKKY
ncbi:MAG: hypothetical protein DRJ05_19010, partial [Bacteroidetes bacterium]